MENTDVHAQQAPLRFEIEQPKEYDQYLLYSRAEIAAILRALMQKRALVSAYFNNNRSFLLTAVLAVDMAADTLVLDCGRESGTNHQALLAKQLLLTAAIDKVKVQFTLGKLSETQHAGLPAFSAALPDKLLRLQRRECFRLSTPITKPVKCIAMIKRADGSTFLLEASLLDISGGGIGLMAPPSLAALLQRGAVMSDCKVSLPDEGLLVASLCVRNKLDLTTKGGSHYVRVGCQFIALPGARMNMLQRYINRIERERKARLSGMA
jgi:c-di-GMP-binding flagellar brake protein YcgR